MTRLQEMRYNDWMKRGDEWEMRDRDVEGRGVGAATLTASVVPFAGFATTTTPVYSDRITDPDTARMLAAWEDEQHNDYEGFRLDMGRRMAKYQALGLYDRCPKCGLWKHVCKGRGCERWYR